MKRRWGNNRRWGQHLTLVGRLDAIILIRWCKACAKTARWLHWRHRP